MAGRARVGDGRRQHLVVLGPEEPALAGVRVQRGDREPRRGQAEAGAARAAVRAIVAVTCSRVSSAGTSRSGTCTVASTTFSIGAWNIIATRGAPHRWPSRSVWPFHGRPAAAKAGLLTGAVAMASTRAVAGVVDGADQRVVGGPARRGADLAHGDVDRGLVDHRLAHGAHRRIGGGLAGDLGSDAGGIADGDRDAGFHGHRIQPDWTDLAIA